MLLCYHPNRHSIKPVSDEDLCVVVPASTYVEECSDCSRLIVRLPDGVTDLGPLLGEHPDAVFEVWSPGALRRRSALSTAEVQKARRAADARSIEREA